MVVFLANRDNVRVRQLHRRVKNRLQSDDRFGATRLRVSGAREPGPYRVTADVDPRWFLDDSSYPVTTTRIEIGFRFPEASSHEFYWLHWVEPERDLLLGWHRDETHPELGPVHVQVNQGQSSVAHEAAQFVDEHPMAVVEARLRELPDALARIEWENGAAVGIDY